MSTSGAGIVSALAYTVMLVATLTTTKRELDCLALPVTPRRMAAAGLWLVVAVPSGIELMWPPIYDTLSRQPQLVREGQWWRLLTSVVVQDGGVAGTVFNLAVLAVVAVVATDLWGPASTTALFVVGAVQFNVLALYFSAPPGGGNSGATFFLATSLVGLLLVRHRSARVWVTGAVVMLDGLLLLLLHDAHGAPILAGVVAGAAGAFPRHAPRPARR